MTSSEDKLFVLDSELNQKLILENNSELFGFQMYELSGQEVYVFIFENAASIINQKGEVILDDLPTSNEISLYYSSKNRKGYIYYSTEDKLMKQGFVLPK